MLLAAPGRWRWGEILVSSSRPPCTSAYQLVRRRRHRRAWAAIRGAFYAAARRENKMDAAIACGGLVDEDALFWRGAVFLVPDRPAPEDCCSRPRECRDGVSVRDRLHRARRRDELDDGVQLRRFFILSWVCFLPGEFAVTLLNVRGLRAGQDDTKAACSVRRSKNPTLLLAPGALRLAQGRRALFDEAPRWPLLFVVSFSS